MKKLMIAAAAAAMVSGVFAVPTYDFSANVKTTTAKYGKQTTTYTVNVGLNAAGVYWWDDLGFDDEKQAKSYVKKLNNDEKADFAWDDLNFDGVSTDYFVKELYKGKYVWCYSFKFKETYEDCYRVAGSRKLKGDVIIEDCCDFTEGWEFTGLSYLENIDWLADQKITTLFLVRFGGLSLEKATKVEYAGEIGDFSDAEVGNWAFAGQGGIDKKLGIISSISGNIVGFLPPTECEDCCDYNAYASYFICDEDGLLIEFVEGEDAVDPTAAFGTWSLKYNAKKTLYSED